MSGCSGSTWMFAWFALVTLAEAEKCLLSVATKVDKRGEALREAGGVQDALNPPSLGVDYYALRLEETLRAGAADMKESRSEKVSRLLCPFAYDFESLRFAGDRANVRKLWEGPPISPFVDGRRSAGRCAVVSNSGVMLSHQHGAEIDAADLIFRFNDAEIGGNLSAAVGSRDDVRFLNNMFLRNMSRFLAKGTSGESTLYVFQRFKPHDEFMYFQDMMEVQKKHRDLHMLLGSDTVELLGKDIMQSAYGSNFSSGGIFTTGWMGVLIAMSMCDEVRAYGFPGSHNSSSAPFHYFGALRSGSADVNEDHGAAADMEKALYRALALNDDVNTTDVVVLPGLRKLQCEQSV
mmetsp:Transcript_10771/g.24604  ORF Transcript_10771/g.24604 Transcript_10771/m.24604 type:complete len:349 (+) Transcript_10771:134-1180(+)|eukprot:CAMPEP_0178389298 /NCGR_PEP_ID=MMETSP0689_2-20121128/10043_1 /TAXON_ID=160604 /ORGANISM="Amphidinium massartii, Strain CS-259" /LENGTH=348 /DNA_ID=CAMNT_0020009741 /DNA_START=53 /DNA_END=1099 /DNA_ORIENTATION=-